MNLIDEVLRLDKEATKGWIGPTPMEEIVDESGRTVLADYRWNGNDAALILAYRTAAPKLARANQKLMEFVRWADDPCAQNWPTWAPLRLDKGDICHATALAGAVLAEIEKELAP